MNPLGMWCEKLLWYMTVLNTWENTGEEGQVNLLVFLELCGKVWHLRMCYGKLTREEPFVFKHGNTVLKRQCIEV